jgi:2-polyprenyl-6-methoxyphenol hydroxylase-like FAD-dependent oxidoreductase
MVMAPTAPAASERVSLDFVIVGGSVAGLASAFALRRAGHNCVVLEAQEGPRKVRRNERLASCMGF